MWVSVDLDICVNPFEKKTHILACAVRYIFFTRRVECVRISEGIQNTENAILFKYTRNCIGNDSQLMYITYYTQMNRKDGYGNLLN